MQRMWGKNALSQKNEPIKNDPITHQSCKSHLDKFFLLLTKCIYPYEDMDSRRNFDETSIAFKENFYSELNLGNTTDKDYAYVQKVWEVFEIKNRGECHDLYVQRDTLLLADVLENFRDKCIEIYELDPAHFLTAPRLAWQTCLNETEVKLELLRDIDMLLMVKNGIRGELCLATHRYAKANNKYMNNYDKTLNHHI